MDKTREAGQPNNGSKGTEAQRVAHRTKRSEAAAGGVLETQVDGSPGKAYRVEVAGDPARDAIFKIHVTYRIDCES